MAGALFLQKLNVKNQKFEGGPVIQLGDNYTSQIKMLLDKTLIDCQDLINLAESIEDASTKVLIAEGRTLEPLYSELKSAIKGLVELVYDLDFNPSLKFYEPLAWQDYYCTKSQSIAFSFIHNDCRPFILGTPILDEPNNLILSLPFDSKIIDDIQCSTRDGISEDELINKLHLNHDQHQSLIRFFSREPFETNNENYSQEGVRVRYFGHVCLLLETRSISILIDPLISYEYPNSIPRFTYSNLPSKIDYVLITHAHQDHFSIETLLKIRHLVKKIIVPRNSKGDLVDPSLKRILKHIGFKEIIELEELDNLSLPEAKITAIPFIGEHAVEERVEN